MPTNPPQPTARRPPAADTSPLPSDTAEVGLAEEWLTKEQVARFFHKSPRTIERWCAMRNAPPCSKFGNTTLFHRPSMREWMAARLTGNQSKPRGRRA